MKTKIEITATTPFFASAIGGFCKDEELAQGGFASNRATRSSFKLSYFVIHW